MKKTNKAHFIGIGGIGVSALAKYYLTKGWQVTGSDLVSSEITKNLRKLGARTYIGKHKAKNLPKNVDLVIYSPAIQKNNPELKAATVRYRISNIKIQKLKIKCLSYPEALGELTKRYFTIAISGTHGKSTTCAMIGLLLTKVGFDPTVIVGTKLKEFGDNNCRVGESKYLVIEADEHFASFLNYWPKIIVLTNIEKEHLDYYKNLRNILKTYQEYINHLPSPPEGRAKVKMKANFEKGKLHRLPREGILVANKEDKNIIKITKQKLVNTTFSTAVENVVYYSSKPKQKETEQLRKILKIPGQHNISNALAALTVARVLKIPDRVSFKALSEYKGSWRRFEEKEVKIGKKGAPPFRGKGGEGGRSGVKKLKIISDYGHHPTEIKVTLQAAREKYPKNKIWLIYQPHQRQRTYYLFKDFVNVFREALRPVQGKSPVDKVVITDIFDVAGREDKEIRKKVNSERLVKAICDLEGRQRKSHQRNGAIYLPKAKILNYLKKNLQGGEVVIIMGAGDIYQLAERLSKS